MPQKENLKRIFKRGKKLKTYFFIGNNAPNVSVALLGKKGQLEREEGEQACN